ncbi:hypothetical protein [Pontibacillus yanchengensis]|uniref:hypothetical protein n=1 Tax=Pontibacillus yanchengensis TaxID=462910 RepID=UPI00192534E9|nr:hypothetical protein [Pontibacillus yanchengensis]
MTDVEGELWSGIQGNTGQKCTHCGKLLATRNEAGMGLCKECQQINQPNDENGE